MSKGMTLDTGFKLEPPIPPIDFDIVRQGKDPNWTSMNVPYDFSPATVRRSHMNLVLERVACPDKSIVQAWLNFARPEEKWTTAKLGIAVDNIIPAINNFVGNANDMQGMADQSIAMERYGPSRVSLEWKYPYWYTTLNLSIEVKRALPEEGVDWLFLRNRTKMVREGRADVHGEIFNAEGELVAVTQQLWLIVGTQGMKGKGESKI
jgi:hypothetical protein